VARRPVGSHLTHELFVRSDVWLGSCHRRVPRLGPGPPRTTKTLVACLCRRLLERCRTKWTPQRNLTTARAQSFEYFCNRPRGPSQLLRLNFKYVRSGHVVLDQCGIPLGHAGINDAAYLIWSMAACCSRNACSRGLNRLRYVHYRAKKVNNSLVGNL
jgi:hypothetical protein